MAKMTNLRRRLRRFRPLMTIVVATTMVWGIWVLSEPRQYNVAVRLTPMGLDTARYVVTEFDTVVNVEMESDGFTAIRRFHRMKNNPIEVDMTKGRTTSYGVAMGVTDWLPTLMRRIDLARIGQVRSNQDSIRVRLAERNKRAYVPQLRDVRFDFAAQCGLNGAPVLKPDTVWLYGSEASLNQIEEVRTQASVVSNMSQTGDYRLPLEPVWERFPDVRPSVTSVQMYVPIGQYSEREVEVPVQFVCSDTTIKAHLYPYKVKVTLLVETKNYSRLEDAMVEAVVYYQKGVGDRLPVVVSRFPEYTRIKHVEPEALQYVIIK